MRRAKALPPNGLLEQLEPTVRLRTCLMGVPLLFETNDASLVPVAEGIFGHFAGACGEGAASGTAEPPLVVRLLVHAPGPTPTVPARPVYRTQGHLLSVVLTPHDSAVADLHAGFAFGVLTPTVARDHPRVRDAFIAAPALAMLGPARGFFPLHAACVVRSGVGVLLVGPAGAGKSTLALACARRGYQVVSDDVVHVDARHVPPRVWGMPWQLRLLPDSVRFFPELDGEVPRRQGNGEAKLEVDLSSVLPGSTRAWAPPGPILLLERGSGAARIEPLTAAEVAAVRRTGGLEPIWSWQVGWRASFDAALERLLAHGVHRFVLAGPPEEGVAALDAFCDRLEARDVAS